MKKTVEATEREFSTIRTGRAHSSLVEGIKVECYGTSMPIKQLASVSTPEPRLIVIQPWDNSILGDVEKSILTSELGITPNNDGKVIRISVPPLTKERRDELAKVLKKITEEGKISLRTARRVGNDEIDRLEKDKIITEDDKFKYKGEIQKLIDKYSKEVDDHLANKEKEIQEV
ncbi:MAG: ribosome recycling factor [Omnitrophica bacterium RBG_13_46_9]|nr:MAG: ribosome recycling factor [Omnitrophica bacterium RBG_13_46_9]